ncbi:MAG: TonB-dependent receptor, partial [Gemmatimonadetes bacterium]|nr:TonB-dependent receptor [Gemmatimonadota bacterium]
FADYADAGDDYFRVVPLAAGGSYAAEDNLAAGYAMLATPLSRRFDLVAGARLERSSVAVASLSTAGEPSLANPTFTDVLPSLALTYRANENLNIRASATQTLSRPEYRELSPILYREVIGFDNIKGNADLQRALIQNYDLRLEYYPRRGEILSVALFAKQFDNPIERIYQGTSGTRIITYVNALGANNYGVELEARKQLDFLSEGLRTLALFANATFMESSIDIDASQGSVTNANRRMVGQAPYVINAGLTWTHPTSDASAT